MNTVEAILSLIPVATAAEGGITSLIQFVATLHASGAMGDADVQKVRDEAVVADADYDQVLADAKTRLGK
jgi:hypothetical protein